MGAEPSGTTSSTGGINEAITQYRPERDNWTGRDGLLERLTEYEPALADSVRRLPMESNMLMVNRILNAGRGSGGGHGLTLLEEARAHPGATYSARGAAGRCIKHHQAPA